MGAGVVIACGCPTSLNVTVTVTLKVVLDILSNVANR